MDSELLTTGEVARLCGVTPDAVLKWIKRGRLPATRTPGGHYRVTRADCTSLGIGEPNGRTAPIEVEDVPLEESPVADDSMRCWEYFSTQGVPRDICRTCLVYRARAQYCYKLAALGEQAGHRRTFCTTNSCEDCPFFRAGHGLATSVLVLTRDESLMQNLRTGVDERRVSLRFARSGYEASAAVGDLCPAVIVMDSDLAEVRDGGLPDTIRRDERVPGVGVIIACREGDELAFSDSEVPRIRAPFDARQLEEVAERASELVEEPQAAV